jgi:DNA replication protein DnaC
VPVRRDVCRELFDGTIAVQKAAAAELLQTVVHQRYKHRRSIVVSSSRVVQNWGRYLDVQTMATTILDRLMHRAAMLEFEGNSYRLMEAPRA